MPPVLRVMWNELETRVRKLEQSPVKKMYGTFYDTTTQTIANTASVYAIKVNTTDLANAVTLVSGSKIKVARAGIFNFQFSIQLENADTSQANDAWVWLRKNGVDVAQTNTKITLANKHSGINGAGIMALNFVLTLAANDYLELWWNANSTQVSIPSYTAVAGPPTYPAVPGVIYTISEVGY